MGDCSDRTLLRPFRAHGRQVAFQREPPREAGPVTDLCHDSMSDEDHILDLLARYARYADERDSSAWGQLFVDEATFAARGSGHYQGRATIQMWFEDLFRAKGSNNRSLHFCCNPAISISGDAAEAVSDVVVCER